MLRVVVLISFLFFAGCSNSSRSLWDEHKEAADRSDWKRAVAVLEEIEAKDKWSVSPFGERIDELLDKARFRASYPRLEAPPGTAPSN